MVRILVVALSAMCVSAFPDAALAQSDPERPALVTPSQIRLVGTWRVTWDRGDEDDFWFWVTQKRLPAPQPIHIVRGLRVDIQGEDLGATPWTIDVVNESGPIDDCGLSPTTCPPSYLELIQIGDWTYRLRAEDDPGVEINDTDIILERLDRPGSASFPLTWTRTGPRSGFLAWLPPQGATAFELLVGVQPGRIDQVYGIGYATSFTVGDVPFGTYFVRARAIFDNFSSIVSNEVVVTSGCSPLPPPLLTFVKEGSVVTLTWLGVDGATNFQIFVGTAPGFSDVFNALPLGLTQQAIYDVAGVTGAFYARVAAVDACGTGTPSNEIVIRLP
jgi:hypothetical protein